MTRWAQAVFTQPRPIPDVICTALPDHRQRLFLRPEWRAMADEDGNYWFAVL
jgi:hypothetical protein